MIVTYTTVDLEPEAHLSERRIRIVNVYISRQWIRMKKYWKDLSEHPVREVAYTSADNGSGA